MTESASDPSGLDRPVQPPQATAPEAFPSGALRRLRRRLAVVHAEVVSMEREQVLPDRTLVIEGGVIVGMARSADVATDGMQVIDAGHSHVMPGLADMHVHLHDVSDALLFLATGVTSVRNMWGTPSHLAFAARVARGELPGPRVVTAGPIVDGAGSRGGPTWPGSVTLTEPGKAPGLVERQVDRGYQQIKAYSLLDPRNLEALGRAARSLGIRMVGHCPDSATFEMAMDAGMSCFEHLTAIANGHLRDGATTAAGMPPAEQIDLSSIRRLAARMAASEVWNCPTLVLWHQLFQSREQAARDPLLRYQSRAKVCSWAPDNDLRLRPMAPVWDRVVEAGQRHNEVLRQIVAILHEEGAPLLVGTDTPNPFVTQGFSVRQELQLLRDSGLSPYQALRCATAGPASFLGESHLWGTLAPRHRADLLFLGANPLEDLRALDRLQAVLVNGFLIERPGLDALLGERAERASRMDAEEVPRLQAVPEGTLIRQGELVDTLAGVPCGSLSFRHSRLDDGRLLVEEQQVRAETTRRSRLWLTPEGALLRGRVSTRTSLGEDSLLITWVPQHHYTVSATEADGARQESQAGDVLLPPAPTLALSLLPQLAAVERRGSADQEVLGVEMGEAAVLRLSLEPTPGEGAGASVGAVLARPTERLELRWESDDSGAVCALDEVGVRGTHRLRPALVPPATLPPGR